MYKKIITFSIFVLLLGLIFLFFINELRKTLQYNDSFNCFNTNVSVTLYNIKNNKAQAALKEIKKIYIKYNKLLNREKEYEKINNLYYITYNTLDSETLLLDEELYDMIKYYKEWYYKSNGLIDISMGNVYDIWKMYINSESGYPKDDELINAHTENINNIVLLDNYMIRNNHVNINLDYVSKSYVTQVVVDTLKRKNITDYKITINNNSYVGNYYMNNDDSYKIMTVNPFNSDYTIIKGNNININTRMITDDSYEFNNKIYNNLISPTNLNQINKIKGVIVITDNIKDSDLISLLLYSMSVKDGKKYADENNIEAIWYTNNNKIVKSKNIEKYMLDKKE